MKGKPNPLKPGFKMCYGVLHREGVWVSLDRWYPSTRQGTHSECQICALERVKPSKRNYQYRGFVSLSRYRFVFIELERRLGRIETARRIGYSQWRIRQLIEGKQLRIQRQTAANAIAVLKKVRIANEVRHRKSIKHGAYLRGHEEKTPTARNDFYKSFGDGDLEYQHGYLARDKVS